MNNMSFLCRIDAIVDGGALAVQRDLAGETVDLIVLRQGAVVRAYHNVCPHAGRRMDYAPGQFLVRSGRLICPAHGATFDIGSGDCVGGPGGGGLSRVVVTVDEAGDVWLAATESANVPIDDD